MDVSGKRFHGRTEFDMPTPTSVSVEDTGSYFYNNGVATALGSIESTSGHIYLYDEDSNSYDVCTLDSGPQWANNNNGRVIQFGDNVVLLDEIYNWFIVMFEEIPTTPYITNATSLIAVADAIRAKGETTAALEFPDGFIAAIENL